MKLAGMTFRAVSNSKNGSLNAETRMRFTSDEEIVLGIYSGGTIVAGHVLGKHRGESEVEMLYQGATRGGEMQAGRALGAFVHGEDGHGRMHIEGQWLTGGPTRGQSD